MGFEYKMTPHYDASLRDGLTATNPSDGVVLNKHFAKWGDHIETNLRTSIATGGDKYESGVDHDLLVACQEHANKYAKPIKADNIIALIHPLYLFLSDMDELSTPSMKDEANAYKEKLLWFLYQNFPRDNMRIITLDTLHNYAAATSLLLEQGLIDKVFFTEHDGCPLVNNKELNQFKYKTFFMAGGYNHICLSELIEEIEKSTHHYDQIWAIQDIITNSPRPPSTSLIPSEIYRGIRRFSEKRVVQLEQVIEMLKLKEAPTSDQ